MEELRYEIFSRLEEIPDPRVDRSKIHSLPTLLFIALCTFLTGGKSFYEMELFAQAHKTWLKNVTGMVSVPSHDTFNRIFQAIKPEHFAEFLVSTTDLIRRKLSGEIVAFDGKTHRGTGNGHDSALHMLNAWAVKNRLVLGQFPVPDKSNEITAMPQLMDMIELKDCVITADALNCQKTIAEKAIEKKADYVLAIKGNHPEAYDEIRRYMDREMENVRPIFEMPLDKGHGRLESRKFWVSEDIDWFEARHAWAGLKSICAVESVRELIKGEETATTRRYYISSLGEKEAEKIAGAIRRHWAIENEFHWCLDMAFDEDKSRARTRNAAKNLGLMRGITMNLLKANPDKGSLKGKMYKASMMLSYLKRLLRI